MTSRMPPKPLPPQIESYIPPPPPPPGTLRPVRSFTTIGIPTSNRSAPGGISGSSPLMGPPALPPSSTKSSIAARFDEICFTSPLPRSITNACRIPTSTINQSHKPSPALSFQKPTSSLANPPLLNASILRPPVSIVKRGASGNGSPATSLLSSGGTASTGELPLKPYHQSGNTTTSSTGALEEARIVVQSSTSLKSNQTGPQKNNTSNTGAAAIHSSVSNRQPEPRSVTTTAHSSAVQPTHHIPPSSQPQAKSPTTGIAATRTNSAPTVDKSSIPISNPGKKRLSLGAINESTPPTKSAKATATSSPSSILQEVNPPVPGNEQLYTLAVGWSGTKQVKRKVRGPPRGKEEVANKTVMEEATITEQRQQNDADGMNTAKEITAAMISPLLSNNVPMNGKTAAKMVGVEERGTLVQKDEHKNDLVSVKENVWQKEKKIERKAMKSRAIKNRIAIPLSSPPPSVTEEVETEAKTQDRQKEKEEEQDQKQEEKQGQGNEQSSNHDEEKAKERELPAWVQKYRALKKIVNNRKPSAIHPEPLLISSSSPKQQSPSSPISKSQPSKPNTSKKPTTEAPEPQIGSDSIASRRPRRSIGAPGEWWVCRKRSASEHEDGRRDRSSNSKKRASDKDVMFTGSSSKPATAKTSKTDSVEKSGDRVVDGDIVRARRSERLSGAGKSEPTKESSNTKEHNADRVNKKENGDKNCNNSSHNNRSLEDNQLSIKPATSEDIKIESSPQTENSNQKSSHPAPEKTSARQKTFGDAQNDPPAPAPVQSSSTTKKRLTKSITRLASRTPSPSRKKKIAEREEYEFSD